MAAYAIFLREGPIRDPALMEAYRKSSGNPELIKKMKPLVVYGAMEALEGQAPDGVVVLEFPTMEDAKAWYFSPEYQKAAKNRQDSADYRGILVEGFTMPPR